eukprot:TRINITY_DN4678_c0_g2_i1.p2 TRINITY_DN4678_c0_g2~~TRINITY_DN4678_c0_g2_i1.p2  ORF type:complete len:129 (-),score=13.07 TRINITY_DN4678_c0_g2_i1:293-679(-)
MECVLWLKDPSKVRKIAHDWNIAKSVSCDDMIFVASCISEGLADEITWPDAAERAQLGRMIEGFPGAMGMIDGTLVECTEKQRLYFNGRKKMYCYNNVVVVDNNGLFRLSKLHIQVPSMILRALETRM